MLFCFLTDSYLIDIFLIFLHLKIFCISTVRTGHAKMPLFSVLLFDLVDHVVNIEDRTTIIVTDAVTDWNIHTSMK